MTMEYQPPAGTTAETQLEIIEHRFYTECAMYGLARALVDRKQAMEHIDALLDAANHIRATGQPINVEAA